MKKMLLIGIYGLIILGASAGGTWYLRQQDLAAQQAAEAGPEVAPLAESVGDLAARVDVTNPLQPVEDPAAREIPVAVRPEEMSVEEIVRYGLGLKQRESAIHEREEALRRTEAQHRLVLADISGEQQEIEGLLAQAKGQREAAQQLLAQAQKQKLDSEQLLKDVEEKQKKLATEREKAVAKGASLSNDTVVDEAANVKKLVEMISAMSAEGGAKAIRDMANDGNTDQAVQVLTSIEPRTASGIMESLQATDEKLSQELVGKILQRRTPIRL